MISVVTGVKQWRDVELDNLWEGVINGETWRVDDRGDPVAFVVPAADYLRLLDAAAPLVPENAEAPAPKGGQ